MRFFFNDNFSFVLSGSGKCVFPADSHYIDYVQNAVRLTFHSAIGFL